MVFSHTLTCLHISLLHRYSQSSRLRNFHPYVTKQRFFYSVLAPYSCVIFTFHHHVQKSNICAMIGIFLCLFGATAGAFVRAERFIDTVDVFREELTNIRHFRVALLAIEHLCKFGKLNAFCTVRGMRHGRDLLKVVYIPLPI